MLMTERAAFILAKRTGSGTTTVSMFILENYLVGILPIHNTNDKPDGCHSRESGNPLALKSS